MSKSSVAHFELHDWTPFSSEVVAIGLNRGKSNADISPPPLKSPLAICSTPVAVGGEASVGG
jgi:hypothetical protein